MCVHLCDMFWALLSPVMWVTGIKLRSSGWCYKHLYLLSYTISPGLESCLNTCLFVLDNTKDCFKSTGYKNHKELSQQPLPERAGLRQQPPQEQVEGSYCLGSGPEPETSVGWGPQASDLCQNRPKPATSARADPKQ